MSDKIVKFSRRNFLWLGGSSFLALPALSIFGGKNDLFLTDFNKPFIINFPMPLTVHGKDFYGILPEFSSGQWSQNGIARSMNFEGSPVFDFQDADIKSQMTVIAGIYNGYSAGSHDNSLCSTLFSQVNNEPEGTKSQNFFAHPNETIDQRIARHSGIKILNTSYMQPISAVDRYGKVASCDASGVLSSGVHKLDTLSTLIFGAPGGGSVGSGGNTGGSGGGTGGGNGGGNPSEPAVDRKKFFELALSGINNLVKSRYGAKLSKIDRTSLSAVEQQLASVRGNFQVMQQENLILDTQLGYNQNVGNLSLEQTSSKQQGEAYLDGLANMIVAGVVTGNYHWVNVGHFAYFRENFTDAPGYSNKMLTRNESHEPSHSLSNNQSSQGDPNVQLLKNCYKRSYTHFYSKILKKLSGLEHPQGGNWLDHGALFAQSEHCSGVYHDSGAKSSTSDPYYGLPTVMFGGLKGENPHRGKILDFRVSENLGGYKRPLRFKHFLGRSMFNAFGIFDDNKIKTSHGYDVGYYSKTDDHPAWDPDYAQVVSKSLKQLT